MQRTLLISGVAAGLLLALLPTAAAQPICHDETFANTCLFEHWSTQSGGSETYDCGGYTDWTYEGSGDSFGAAGAAAEGVDLWLHGWQNGGEYVGSTHGSDCSTTTYYSNHSFDHHSTVLVGVVGMGPAGSGNFVLIEDTRDERRDSNYTYDTSTPQEQCQTTEARSSNSSMDSRQFGVSHARTHGNFLHVHQVDYSSNDSEWTTRECTQANGTTTHEENGYDQDIEYRKNLVWVGGVGMPAEARVGQDEGDFERRSSSGTTSQQWKYTGAWINIFGGSTYTGQAEKNDGGCRTIAAGLDLGRCPVEVPSTPMGPPIPTFPAAPTLP